MYSRVHMSAVRWADRQWLPRILAKQRHRAGPKKAGAVRTVCMFKVTKPRDILFGSDTDARHRTAHEALSGFSDVRTNLSTCPFVRVFVSRTLIFFFLFFLIPLLFFYSLALVEKNPFPLTNHTP